MGHRSKGLTKLETAGTPTLPGTALPTGVDEPGAYTRAEVELSFPLENVGPSLPNLMTTVAGNLFGLSPFSGLRLLDVDIPAELANAHPGP